MAVEVVCLGIANRKDTQSSLYLLVSISNQQKGGWFLATHLFVG
jgi:hypothetical protein